MTITIMTIITKAM